MSIEAINLWHSRARPTPDAAQFNVQLGCHLEEIVEMLDTIVFNQTPDTSEPPSFWRRLLRKFNPDVDIPGYRMNMRACIHALAQDLKRGYATATITDRKGFLDAIADQVVTGVGAAYCAGMNAPEAVRRVDSSNWSKFVDGQPVFDENGKVTKGPYYKPVDLTGLY